VSEPWRIVFARAAARQLEGLPPRLGAVIAARIAELADEPRGLKSRRVVGTEFWRIRVGQLRVVYEVDEAERIVVIVRVARRGERTYRRLG
jgi:mRNA interferase RelE/StbE